MFSKFQNLLFTFQEQNKGVRAWISFALSLRTQRRKDIRDILLFFFLKLIIYLFMAVLGLRFCARAFSSCGERGPLFIAVSLVAEHRLQTRGLSNCGARAQ